ncbi:MAG: type II secretion system GspH family protein [Deltaproteobacteria bacterium]
MKRKNGFSLIELLIVFAILAVMLTVATLYWQRYVARINLRSAARHVASDMTEYRGRAVSESRVYTITFSGTDKYNIAAPAQSSHAAFNIDAKPMETAGAPDVQIKSSNFTGCHVVRFTPRGLVEHCAVSPGTPGDTGTVTLQNDRGATATITLNSRGTVDVTFANF